MDLVWIRRILIVRVKEVNWESISRWVTQVFCGLRANRSVGGGGLDIKSVGTKGSGFSLRRWVLMGRDNREVFRWFRLLDSVLIVTLIEEVWVDWNRGLWREGSCLDGFGKWVSFWESPGMNGCVEYEGVLGLLMANQRTREGWALKRFLSDVLHGGKGVVSMLHWFWYDFSLKGMLEKIILGLLGFCFLCGKEEDNRYGVNHLYCLILVIIVINLRLILGISKLNLISNVEDFLY